MRGIPNNPVACRTCGRQRAARADELCHSCRIKGRPNANERFSWNDALDERLRRLYASSHTRMQLSANLNDFQRSTGFTRVVIITRARVFGLTTRRGTPWSGAEVSVLQETIGTASLSTLATKLNRSYYSVKAKVRTLQLYAGLRDGYSICDLQTLLGVGRGRVCQWIRRRWMKLEDGRVAEASVLRFLRQHPDEYHLARVDEAWFKGLVFPRTFGRFGG